MSDERVNIDDITTTKTAIADADRFVGRDSSGDFKTLWSSIKSVLKTYFDTLYTAIGAGYVSVSSGDGAPTSTPDAIGDIYIDTTGNRKYYAVGTGSSADWIKEAVYYYDEFTVTAGDGDVVRTLPWDWTDGKLDVVISNATTEYYDDDNERNMKFETTYQSLVSAGYSAGNIMRLVFRSASPEYNIYSSQKTDNRSGLPKSATTNSITFDDDGSTTSYLKISVWA